MASFLDNYLGTLRRPGRTFAALAEDDVVWPGAAAVASAALVYSVFVLWMYLAGHEPSFTGNPIPAETYYLWQAILLPPWLLLSWAVAATVAYGLSRMFGSESTWTQNASPLGFAFAIPLTWAYLVPEMVVFGLYGHDALTTAMVYTGPIAVLWWLFLYWKVFRTVGQHLVLATIPMVFLTQVAFAGVMAVLVR
jgi:hypothetical protein